MRVNDIKKDLKNSKFGISQIDKETPKTIKYIRAFMRAVNNTLIGSGLISGNNVIAWIGLGAGIINETITYLFGED